VEGIQLAETEMIDDRVVTPAGVGAYLPPERRVARHLSTIPALTPAQSRVKRCLDLIGAISGLVVLAPVFAIVAVLVAFDSPGPILFAQTRVGFLGRTFRMLKFRTMHDGADNERAAVANLNRGDDTRLFKIPGDPRVTRLGRVLRRWSLDELPQLYNILKGEMSLVGPRPFFESDLDDYEAHHFRRLSVPPGLTGLWQVSGRSDIVAFEEVVRLDRYYIEHWSLGLDLRILASTLPTVISRRGAY
jgi:lipopolysaccharide/colanic/teichoic acid biosynthesis glycosyltransferase